MRIFSAQPYYDPFGRDMDSALKKMGIDIISYDLESPFYDQKRHKKKVFTDIKRRKERVNEKLIEIVKRENKKKKIDLFFTVTDLFFTTPSIIEKIKKLGIATMNFGHDDVPHRYFMKVCKDLAEVFDYNWTFQPSAVESYKKIGANVIYIPGGANPDVHKKYNLKREYDVTFTGVNKGYRKKIIQMISDENIDVHAWGSDWNFNMEYAIGQIGDNINDIRHSNNKIKKIIELLHSELTWKIKHHSQEKEIFDSFLPFEEMIKMYSRSKISLNFAGYIGMNVNTTDFTKAPKGLKGRDFEAPMSGAFYLTEHSDEIAQLYEIGKEIETYRNVPELIDKIKHYLENPEEAVSIRNAGRKKALDEYTWEKAFKKVFNEIGIS